MCKAVLPFVLVVKLYFCMQVIHFLDLTVPFPHLPPWGLDSVKCYPPVCCSSKSSNAKAAFYRYHSNLCFFHVLLNVSLLVSRARIRSHGLNLFLLVLLGTQLYARATASSHALNWDIHSNHINQTQRKGQEHRQKTCSFAKAVFLWGQRQMQSDSHI